MTFDNTKPIKSVNHNGVDVPLDILNIDYGATPPSDVSKLWIPLENRPVHVEVNGEFMPYGDDYIDTTWADAPKMIAPLRECAYATVGSKIYLFGGYKYSESGGTSASLTKDIYIYDTVENTYSLSNAQLAYLADGACAAAYGTKIYIFGGNVQNLSANTSVQEYDTETDTITLKQSGLHWQFHHSSAIPYKNKIYLLGGVQGTSTTSVVDTIREYDVENDALTTLSAKLPQALANACLLLANNTIYVVAGETNWSSSNETVKYIYSFTPDTNEVATLSVYIADRNCAKSGYAAVGNKLYLFGGRYYASSKHNPVNTIQFFDADTLQTGVLESTLPEKITWPACGTVGDYVYIVGGFYNSGSSQIGIDTIQRFAVKTVLQSRHLKIFTDMYRKQTAIVNTAGVKLFTTVREAYIGGSDNYAQRVNVYVHDGMWKSLDGESVTQDMLNALAELGVT